ncbi:methyltransferase family protein [Hasllibacter halocynthiae]|uniref:Methyltransferase family protein n=1 Tax=Hasllibacter halocynthiae TaxID=595589 RepID=A0A2T0X386_9RHOB|nr:class I SAM-dependent methyltransferase [Hasllibacter halocynthiae]PRY93416.1 methyltransferase family protein [Hasllibacter halocynthiae]
MSDARTLAAYAAHASDYASRFRGPPDADLLAFVSLLPDGARVLDLGCGPGGAARHLADMGHTVDAVDASPAMVRLARARGVRARVADFDALDAEDAYHGVWANFSLLHAPRRALPGHLAAIARALRPGGALHIGLKLGRGERRDRLGRLYAYWTEGEVAALLREADLVPVAGRTGEDAGLAGATEPYLILRARLA